MILRASARRAAKLSVIGAVLGIVCVAHAQEVPAGDLDATAVVENLGIPAAPYYPPKANNSNIYPRNVWSLAPFQGRLYIGNGNSSNYQPSPNAGPAPVLSYDPSTNLVTQEFLTSDEQVDVFRVINGELVIPGHDPLGSWALGNFYRRRNGVWSLIRTIPYGIHNFDMASFGGALYAALGTPTGGAVAQSLDDGLTWTNYGTVNTNSNRVYQLIDFQGNLYGSSDAIDFPAGCLLNQWTGSGLVRLTTSSVPGARAYRPQSNAKFLRNVQFAGQLVYIMAYQFNDQQSRPFGLYTAATISTPVAVPLPTGEIPYDLAVAGDQLFVLTGTPNGTGGYTVQVRATTDTNVWPVVFHFTASTLPRSFALLNGDFYIGLGSDPAAAADIGLSPDTGTLLRVKGAAIPPAGPVTFDEPKMPALLKTNRADVRIEDNIQFNRATQGVSTLTWRLEDSAHMSFLTGTSFIPAMAAGTNYKLVIHDRLRTGPSGDDLHLYIVLNDISDNIAVDSQSKTTLAVEY